MSEQDKDTKAMGFLESMDRNMRELLDLAKGSRGAPADDPPAADPKARKIKDDAPPDPKPKADDPPKGEDPPEPKRGKGFLATLLGG